MRPSTRSRPAARSRSRGSSVGTYAATSYPEHALARRPQTRVCVSALVALAISACSLAAPTDAELMSGLSEDGGDAGSHSDGATGHSGSSGADGASPRADGAPPGHDGGTKDVTTHCAAEGDSCGAGCCAGLSCAAGKCGAACVASGDHCGGTGQGDCCSGLTCTGGTCGATACVALGQPCSTTAACCTGSCSPGHHTCR